LKKTFTINIDILKRYIISNNNPINTDNQIISSLNSILDNAKKRDKIIEKIREKKSKLLIENQISSEKKRKNEEKRYSLRDKIKENQDRIDNKEEYMKVLHKKLREVEIYIHKNTTSLKDLSRRRKYQTFSMFNFIETNNDLIKQKKDLNKLIETTKQNHEYELEENKRIKMEVEKEKEEKVDNNEEAKIKKLTDKYNNKIKLLNLRLNSLKSTYKKVNKKIKLLKIGNLDNNSNNNKEDEKNDEQSKIQLDITVKNSFMDFSVLNTKNFEDSKFEISKIGNNFGNISNFGIYDISIIDQK
jgi:chromosome segregation ATPase